MGVFIRFETDVAEQAGQQGGMQLFVGCRRFVHAPALFAHNGQQLRMDVAPLAQAQLRQEAGAAMVLQLAIRFFVGDGLFKPGPDLEVTLELGLVIGEFLVRLVGSVLRFHRAIARILHRQRRGDDQQFGETGIVAPGQDHATDARIERQLGELLAQRRQLVELIDRAELLQQLVTVGDRAAQRRLDEGEGLDIGQVQRLHAQDDRGQRRAQDFRLGEFRPLQIILLFIQADTHARSDTTATTGALVGGRLRNRFNLQLLDLVAVAVALHARQAGVDHVADAGHRQRGFGDVGRQYDAARVADFENAFLLLRRQARKQRQDLDVRRMVLAQRLGGVADYALAGQEYQDVPRPYARQFIDGVDHGVHQVALFAVLLRLRGATFGPGTGVGHLRREVAAIGVVDRTVANLDRVQTSRHFDHRCRLELAVDFAAEVAREAVGIDGG